MIGLTDVFVSYKAEDRSRLLPFVEALEAEGFSVWWDTHIGGGAHWREDIQEHLDAAKCVIVVWSRRSVGPGGDFVRDEANRARKRGAYLPIRLDSSEPPLGFGEIQAVSLKGWRGDRSDPRFRAISDAVRRRIAGEDSDHARLHYQRSSISRRSLLTAGVATAAIGAAAGGWFLLRPPAANAKRIAVLPFADLSPSHDQAYFSEGIAEELRSALSRIGLQVIGRNSCEAAKDLDIKAVAAKLDVANILTGSVRRSPETIRIDAQLVSGSDGVERWAQSYDRAPGDAIAIQTDIAQNVAQALSIALGQAVRAALILGGTRDSVAQDLILQSRNLRRQGGGLESYRRRLVLAEEAIARDPAYADAYVDEANVLATLASNYAPSPATIASELARAGAAARKAISLAPKFGPAHEALGLVAQSQLDFPTLLRQTRLAVSLSPNDPDLLPFAGRNLAWFGNEEEGLQLIDRAIALDPLNGRQYRYQSEVLTFLRRYPEAVAAARKALKLAPGFEAAHLILGDALLLLGRPVEAKPQYEVIGADNPFRLSSLALLAARTGDPAGAERTIGQLKQQAGAAASFQYAEIYAQLGEKDQAFAELSNAAVAPDPGLIYLKVDPFLDPIRNDARYAALLRRLNFP
ncbi:MAG TPA: TIR domain-containing protein [Steroidobacteraceae bacterium]|jgi:serine/threonine-protein kinase|nr:TIR domain-containing protein [Steroidobacteraceae bacterium]